MPGGNLPSRSRLIRRCTVPGGALRTGRIPVPEGVPVPRLSGLPRLCINLLPHPPDPRSKSALPTLGKGENQSYLMQGASPLASPRLCRGRHWNRATPRRPYIRAGTCTAYRAAFGTRRGACAPRHQLTLRLVVPEGVSASRLSGLPLPPVKSFAPIPPTRARRALSPLRGRGKSIVLRQPTPPGHAPGGSIS